ncbi:unnamed protein product [Closterium sp. NIES-53]
MPPMRAAAAGYPTWKGQILDGEQLWALIEGLEANGLLFYSHLLTGGYAWLMCMSHVCTPALIGGPGGQWAALLHAPAHWWVHLWVDVC